MGRAQRRRWSCAVALVSDLPSSSITALEVFQSSSWRTLALAEFEDETYNAAQVHCEGRGEQSCHLTSCLAANGSKPLVRVWEVSRRT
jgi:hypothetical protein